MPVRPCQPPKCTNFSRISSFYALFAPHTLRFSSGTKKDRHPRRSSSSPIPHRHRSPHSDHRYNRRYRHAPARRLFLPSCAHRRIVRVARLHAGEYVPIVVQVDDGRIGLAVVAEAPQKFLAQPAACQVWANFFAAVAAGVRELPKAKAVGLQGQSLELFRG